MIRSGMTHVANFIDDRFASAVEFRETLVTYLFEHVTSTHRREE